MLTYLHHNLTCFLFKDNISTHNTISMACQYFQSAMKWMHRNNMFHNGSQSKPKWQSECRNMFHNARPCNQGLLSAQSSICQQWDALHDAFLCLNSTCRSFHLMFPFKQHSMWWKSVWVRLLTLTITSHQTYTPDVIVFTQTQYGHINSWENNSIVSFS